MVTRSWPQPPAASWLHGEGGPLCNRPRAPFLRTHFIQIIQQSLADDLRTQFQLETKQKKQSGSVVELCRGLFFLWIAVD